MKALLAALLILAGCSQRTVSPGWQPLAGTQHFTPKGFEFWWLHQTSRYLTPEAAGLAIDEAYEEWFTYYINRWGGVELFLLPKLLAVKVQLWPYGEVPGNSEERELGIYWIEHGQIDVAMKAPLHLDSWLGIYTSGIEVLKHEWTHVIRGPNHE